ncbi:MAG: hypothetical protein V6S10_02290 [Candidatus Methanoglobus sp.]
MLIDTPRRLHLGIIDPSGSLGRRFGSLGAGIEGGYLVKIEGSEGTEIIAEREYIEDALEKMDKRYLAGFDFLIKVERRVERHVGLGSTTQLKLAVGLGVARLKKIDAEIAVSGEVANGGFGQARNVIVYLDFGNRTEEFFIGTISPSDSDSFSIPATGSERNVRITVEWINDLGEIHKISKTYQLTQRSFDFGQRESSIFSSLNMAILAILAVAAVAGILFYRRRRGRR